MYIKIIAVPISAQHIFSVFFNLKFSSTQSAHLLFLNPRKYEKITPSLKKIWRWTYIKLVLADTKILEDI